MKHAILTTVASFAAGAGLVTMALSEGANVRRESNAVGGLPRAASLETARVAPHEQGDATYGDVAPAGSPFTGVEVELVGYEDRWQVGYRGPGGATVRPDLREVGRGPGGTTVVRLPADTDVRLNLTSRDFVYLLNLPRINKSQVAVPGREFRLEFRSRAPGVFVLAGGHLCGPAKPALDLTVYVDPKPEFEAWLDEQARDRTRGVNR
jgi:heme/copper-type cytochrome/quinol oxidase subunit 2